MLLRVHNNLGYVYGDLIPIKISDTNFTWKNKTGKVTNHIIQMPFFKINNKEYPVNNNSIYINNTTKSIDPQLIYNKPITIKLLTEHEFGDRVYIDNNSPIYKFDDGDYLGIYKMFNTKTEYIVSSNKQPQLPIIDYFNEFNRDFIDAFDKDFYINLKKVMTFRLGKFSDDFIKHGHQYKTACYLSSSYIKEDTNHIPYVSELLNPELIIFIIKPGVSICEVCNNSIADESEILIKYDTNAILHKTAPVQYFKNTAISLWPIDSNVRMPVSDRAEYCAKFDNFIQSIMMSSYYNDIVIVNIVELLP